MSRMMNLLLMSSCVAALSACASQSITQSSPLTDAQRSECASLRSQNVDMNQTAIMPDYCKDQAGLSWSSEPKDAMKLELGKDKKDDQ